MVWEGTIKTAQSRTSTHGEVSPHVHLHKVTPAKCKERWMKEGAKERERLHFLLSLLFCITDKKFWGKMLTKRQNDSQHWNDHRR